MIAVFPVLIAVCFLWLAMLIVGIVVLVRGLRKHAGDCGRCGYSAQRITSMVCPECGNDFREVGLHQPQARKTGSIAAGIILISLALLIPLALIFLAAFLTTAPSQPRAFPTTTTQTSPTPMPAQSAQPTP